MLRVFLHLSVLIFLAGFLSPPVLAQETLSTDYVAVVKQIEQEANALLKNYDPQKPMPTLKNISRLYYDVYEGSGMENAVNALSPSMNRVTEAAFMQWMQEVGAHAPPKKIEQQWQVLQQQLQEDLKLLQQMTHAGFWEIFLQSFMILFREGFEALLVVAALLTYLYRAQLKQYVPAVYTGVATALLASIGTAYLLLTWLAHLGSGREAIEGITQLVAAAVLLYVSYWLFSHGLKRKQALDRQVQQALSTKNSLALGTAAFLAVYREGAETILFYEALMSSSHGPASALWAGIGVALFTLLAVYFIMRKTSIKLPYRWFFAITAIFLYFMAFCFIGHGIHELQEAMWIKSTPIHGFITLPLLGIFPTLEGISSQLAFLIPTALGLAWWYKKQRRSHA